MKRKFLFVIAIISALLLGYKTEQSQINKEMDATPQPTEMISVEMEEAQSYDLGSISSVERYVGYPSVEVNCGNPYFTEEELAAAKSSFETYSELDSLGRVRTAYASLGSDTMPTKGEERGSISNIKPTGWETKKYDCINGMYVYNRCHLIAWCLGAENDNPQNLCTGTRYMNVDGMLPYEEMVAEYLDQNPNNRVLYRVTPVFEGDNLVCNGVLMEAQSIGDKGEGIKFCVFCYNVQPGVEINYATGATSYNGVFMDTLSSSVNYCN